MPIISGSIFQALKRRLLPNPNSASPNQLACQLALPFQASHPKVRLASHSSTPGEKVIELSSADLARLFKMEKSINVFGRPLAECGRQPITGFFRDGYCNTSPMDGGSHTVAAKVSKQWLEFSASRGNDLRPMLGDGDCFWCLCSSRWKEALTAWKSGELPKEAVPKWVVHWKAYATIVMVLIPISRVNLEATHVAALRSISLDDLKEFALPKSSDPASAKTEL